MTLNQRPLDRQDWHPREDRGAFWNRVYDAVEGHGFQVGNEFSAEELEGLQVVDVFLGVVEAPQLFNDLFQAGGDDEAAVVWNSPVKDVEDGFGISWQGFKVAVSH